ncbi:MAG: hypothetical protein ACXIU8_14150 [Alkalilacustris sp.]
MNGPRPRDLRLRDRPGLYAELAARGAVADDTSGDRRPVELQRALCQIDADADADADGEGPLHGSTLWLGPCLGRDGRR